MKLWIARDKDGYSQLFVEEPIKKNGYFEKIPNTRTFTISCLLFPEVTFENSPKEIELKLVGMKEDLCKSCENHWTDFPLPLEQAESHCTIVDEKVGFGKMNEVVPYPCLECPFNCYSKKN